MTQYNTSRNLLMIREYGRNVQKMVENLLLIDDYEKRTEGAKAVVRVMAQLNPDAHNAKEKDTLDYWHKLWDHLFIISDYRLDVDSPFPKPERKEKMTDIPEYQYHKKKIANRTYGRNMEKIIKCVAAYPESPQKQRLVNILANHLKKLYLVWNRDSVDDALIVRQLKELSEGKIELANDFKLASTREILNQNQKKNTAKSSHRKKKKKKKEEK